MGCSAGLLRALLRGPGGPRELGMERPGRPEPRVGLFFQGDLMQALPPVHVATRPRHPPQERNAGEPGDTVPTIRAAGSNSGPLTAGTSDPSPASGSHQTTLESSSGWPDSPGMQAASLRCPCKSGTSPAWNSPQLPRAQEANFLHSPLPAPTLAFPGARSSLAVCHVSRKIVPPLVPFAVPCSTRTV